MEDSGVSQNPGPIFLGLVIPILVIVIIIVAVLICIICCFWKFFIKKQCGKAEHSQDKKTGPVSYKKENRDKEAEPVSNKTENQDKGAEPVSNKTENQDKGAEPVSNKTENENPDTKNKEELERRKDLFRENWRTVNLYPDWRKEFFQSLEVTLDPDTAHPELIVSKDGSSVTRGKEPQDLTDTEKRFDSKTLSTVEVTLDPDTAHPELIVSEDRRRVTHEEKPQDLPHTGKRFDSMHCVLGLQNIASDRYYWEVEVGNKPVWDLGVCRDNVKRKENVTVSPENGFWGIRLYNDEYWALTSPPTSLNLKEKPRKICVFLDYDSGDVAFYNMTNNSHIHTFTSLSFYSALYPFFRLWSSDSEPLIMSRTSSTTRVKHS